MGQADIASSETQGPKPPGPEIHIRANKDGTYSIVGKGGGGATYTADEMLAFINRAGGGGSNTHMDIEGEKRKLSGPTVMSYIGNAQAPSQQAPAPAIGKQPGGASNVTIGDPDAAVRALIGGMGGNVGAVFAGILATDPSLANSVDELTQDDIVKFMQASGGGTLDEIVQNTAQRLAWLGPIATAAQGAAPSGEGAPAAAPSEGGGAGAFYDFSGGAGGGAGAGAAYPPGAYFDYLSRLQSPETYGGGDYFNFLRAQLPPGGPGTAGNFYDAISKMASPLGNLGGDFWSFLSNMVNPAPNMPGQFYTQLGSAAMPISNMPNEFWSMMQAPSYVAEGMPAAPTGMFGALAQSGANTMPFLASLLQGQPELAMALVQNLIGMQQQAGMPFLPFLLGPAGGAYGQQAQAPSSEEEVIDLSGGR